MAVTKEGAKAAFFAIRKASRVPLHAIVYCNGSNSVGQLHTRVPLNGIQDLVQKKCLSDNDKIIPQNYNQLLPESCQLMIAWEGFVLELTREQACMPCFEMLLVMWWVLHSTTGCAALSIFFCLDYESLGDDARAILRLFGMSVTRKSESVVLKKTDKQLKAAYKALG